MSTPLVFFVVLVGIAIVQLKLYARFLREMRLRHPNTWESLGSPVVKFGSDFSRPALKFLWRRDYRELKDAEFSKRSDVLRVCLITYFVLLAVAIVWTIILAFIGATGHI